MSLHGSTGWSLSWDRPSSHFPVTERLLRGVMNDIGDFFSHFFCRSFTSNYTYLHRHLHKKLILLFIIKSQLPLFVVEVQSY